MNEISVYRRMLADIDNNIDILQRQVDAIDPNEGSAVLSQEMTKKEHLEYTIYELRIRRYNAMRRLKQLENEQEEDE